MTKQEVITELKLNGWTYLGTCNCNPPLMDFMKDKHRVKYDFGKDLYNLFDRNRKVVSIGKSDDLLLNLRNLNLI